MSDTGRLEKFTTHSVHRPRTEPQSKAVYHRVQWRRLRRMVLAREPVCRKCKRELAVDVDHINGDNTDMRMCNLQPLCKACHTRKTHHDG